MHIWFWKGNLRERDHFEYLGEDGTVILEWIFSTLDGLIRLMIRTGGGHFECGNEPSGSIR